MEDPAAGFGCRNGLVETFPAAVDHVRFAVFGFTGLNEVVYAVDVVNIEGAKIENGHKHSFGLIFVIETIILVEIHENRKEVPCCSPIFNSMKLFKRIAPYCPATQPGSTESRPF